MDRLRNPLLVSGTRISQLPGLFASLRIHQLGVLSFGLLALSACGGGGGSDVAVPGTAQAGNPSTGVTTTAPAAMPAPMPSAITTPTNSPQQQMGGAGGGTGSGSGGTM